MALSIQTYIISVAAILTIPLYIRILVILLKGRKRERFNNHFYSISISHAFIDIVGFVCYFTAFNLRGLEILQPFYWSLNNTYFVQWAYCQTYLFLYARYIGIVLISVQRVITVSFPNSAANYYLRQCPTCVFFAVQWILPIPLCAKILLAPMEFDGPVTLNHVIPQDVLSFHYIQAALIPILAIVICSICYGYIIFTYRKNKINKIKRFEREIKLCIQVVGLLLALALISIHFSLQTIFNSLNMTSAVFTMRFFLPLYVGLLTFINPWMMLVINKDVQSQLLHSPFSESTQLQNVRNRCEVFSTNVQRKATISAV